MEASYSGIIKNNNSSYNDYSNRNNSLSIHEGIDISQNDDIKEFRVVLIGSTSVGKTSIFNKFMSGDFSATYKSTLTVEFKTKYLKIDNDLYVKLILWDTCGSENFRAVTKQYYRGANAIILVFDLTDQNSFNDIKNIWINDVKNYCEKNIQILIVGNKLDLIEKRTVSESQVINFCRENRYKYIEASAKEGINILKIFEELSYELASNFEKKREEEMNSQFLIGNFEEKNIITDTKNKKFGCC